MRKLVVWMSTIKYNNKVNKVNKETFLRTSRNDHDGLSLESKQTHRPSFCFWSLRESMNG